MILHHLNEQQCAQEIRRHGQQGWQYSAPRALLLSQVKSLAASTNPSTPPIDNSSIP